MKKAQNEIFGIAIVVLIITVAFFFYIAMNFGKKESAVEGVSDTHLAQRFVDTILRTKTQCGATVAEIVKDCAGTNKDICAPEDSCKYANKTINNALEITIAKLRKPYRLTVKQGDFVLFTIMKGCDDSMEREAPGMQPIPAVPIINVRLDICKK